MIPIGLPSVGFVLLTLALLLATAIWFGWTLRLALAWRKFRQLQGIWLLAYAALGAVALFTTVKFVELQLHLNAYQKAQQTHYHPVLSAPQRLGGIDMPAGTQLRLAVADREESFQLAVFPAAVPVAGIRAERVERYVGVETDDDFKPRRVTAENMRVTGQGISIQQDWHCDASQPITFTVHADATLFSFDRCVLADGNSVDGIALPAGTELWTSTGTVYVDGFVDQDRWVISVPDDAEIRIDGLALSGPLLKLDSQRRLYEVERAVLMQGGQLGAVDHPAGTIAHLNPRRLRVAHAGAWIFDLQVDETQGQNAVESRRVVQDRSGMMLVSSNPDAASAH